MTAPLVWIFFILLAISVPVAHAMLGGVAAALWLDGKLDLRLFRHRGRHHFGHERRMLGDGYSRR